MKDVKIYTVNYCPYCKRAKKILEQQGVEFEDVDITYDEEQMRPKLAKMTGGRDSVPQIFVDGQSIGGCTDLEEIISSGKFEEVFM